MLFATRYDVISSEVSMSELKAMLQSLLALVGLGMTATAEGMETQEQLDMVKSEGYNEVQGYFYSPPRPVSEINDRYFPELDKEVLFEFA